MNDFINYMTEYYSGSGRSLSTPPAVKESAIDFPRDHLSSEVWVKDNNQYTLRADVQGEILSALEKYPTVNLVDIANRIWIVGSMASNTYSDSADVDVHVVPNNIKDWSDADVKAVMDYYKDEKIFFGDHPFEVYIQRFPDQDLMSDGAYDILTDTWEKDPTIRPIEYNPYENFKHVFDELSGRVKVADELLGELRRDVIDYNTMRDALESLDSKSRADAVRFMEEKLDEVETDIEKLYTERKQWADARKFASKPSSPEEALKDVELARNWADENAIFKFINRYQYLQLIGDLHEMLLDDEIDDEEMVKLKKTVSLDSE